MARTGLAPLPKGRTADFDRGRWLAERGFAGVSGVNGVAPKPEMMRRLRQRETAHLAETPSRQLNAIHVPHEPGTRISGIPMPLFPPKS